MTILCGTDFSDASARAAEAAASFAKVWKEPLLLLHALELGERLPETEKERVLEQLEREAERLAALGVAVRSRVEPGSSDVVLVQAAERESARLVVIGALGRRGGAPFLLGSTADRVAQSSKRPVLVARGDALARWPRDGTALRVLVAVDATPTSDAAVRWIGELESAGSCEVVFAHVYWPPEVRERMKVRGGLRVGRGHPDVEGPLEAELRARIEALRAGRPAELRMVGGLGRVADHVIEIAEAERSDLVVVGTRQEKGLARVWHGSVSHGVIDLAPVSVLSVTSQARG